MHYILIQSIVNSISVYKTKVPCYCALSLFVKLRQFNNILNNRQYLIIYIKFFICNLDNL